MSPHFSVVGRGPSNWHRGVRHVRNHQRGTGSAFFNRLELAFELLDCLRALPAPLLDAADIASFTPRAAGLFTRLVLLLLEAFELRENFPALAFEVMRFVAAPQHFPALIYSGATFPPEEAHGLGLIDEVVDARTLLDRALADARTLAALSPQAFAVTKRQLRLDITERIKKHGRRIDAEATKIWASEKATQTIREYVARRLGK